MTSLIGNPTFSPRYISGCALWLDAADSNTVIRSGSNINQWNDKSGNGYNLTAFNNPQYTINAQNSLPVVTFNGTSTYLQNTLFTNSGPYAAFYIMKANSIGGGSSGWRTLSDNVSGLRPFVGFDDTGRRTAYRIGGAGTLNVEIWSLQYSASDLTAFNVNGSSVIGALAGYGGIGHTNGIRIGFAGNNTAYFSGWMGEIIFYNTTLSTAQRQQIEGYLAWKWNLQSSLPTTHPYYYNEAVANLKLTRPVPNPYNANNINLFSPTAFAGCALWLDAADSASVIRSGSNVTQWNDKSGNGRNATPSNNPTYISSNINMSNTSYFNGSINIAAGTLVTTAFTVAITPASFAVETNRILSVNNGTGNDFNSPTGFVYSGILPAGTGYAYRTIAAATTATINTTTRFLCTTLYFSNGGFIFSYNGNFPNGASSNYASNTNTTNTNNLTKYYIGVANVGGNSYNTGQGWKGGMNEVIIYNRTLSQNEYQQVEGYLAWKWGLQSNLPANHPYRVIKEVLPAITTLPYPFTSPTLQNYTLSPRSFSGLALWLDAADSSTVGLSGASNIISIRDKSSNAFLFSNATGFTYNVTKFNGSYPSFYNLTPSLSNNLGSNTSLSFSQPLTVFTVANKIGFLPTYIFDSPISVARIAILSSSLFAGNQIGSISINGSNFIFSSLFNTTNSIGYKDGTQYVAGNVGINNLISGLLLANRYTLNNSWDGHICEIIFYNRVLSTSQRQQIEGYLAWKWGLQKSLPSSHPYVLFPP